VLIVQEFLFILPTMQKNWHVSLMKGELDDDEI